jgi:hypothetical protein
MMNNMARNLSVSTKPRHANAGLTELVNREGAKDAKKKETVPVEPSDF